MPPTRAATVRSTSASSPTPQPYVAQWPRPRPRRGRGGRPRLENPDNEQTDHTYTVGERRILVRRTVYPTNDTHIDYTATTSTGPTGAPSSCRCVEHPAGAMRASYWAGRPPRTSAGLLGGSRPRRSVWPVNRSRGATGTIVDFLPLGNASDLGYVPTPVATTRRPPRPHRRSTDRPPPTVGEHEENPMAARADFDQSAIDDRPPSVAAQFLDRVTKRPDAEAYRYPDAQENWDSLTWAESGERVRQYAAGLVALGIAPEERVGIASGTRYEWILADLAVMCAGAATTTVYPSTNADDTAFILSDSGSRVVFAEDDEQIEKLRENRAELPR